MSAVASPPVLPRRVPERFAAPALAVVALGAAAVVLYAGRTLSFYFDEWSFIIDRHGWSAGVFLQPHNEHLSLVPVVVYKLLFVTAGLNHYWPYRVVVIALHLLVVALVFLLARRRVGAWGAAMAGGLLALLGAAWQNLLWPFQIGFVGAIAAGLGAWLALDRGSRRGDPAAAALLTVSVASASLGIAFLVGTFAELVFGSRRRLRRLWVVLTPLALYALWYIVYGRSGLDWSNAPVATGWALDLYAASAGALIGKGLDWGRSLAVVLAAAAAWRLVTRPSSFSPRAAALLGTAVLFWLLAALARADQEPPETSRYYYVGAVIIVLLAVELARVPHVHRAATAAAVAVGAALVALAFLSGMAPLRDGARGLRSTSTAVQAEIGAMELAGATVPPDYQPDPQLAPQVTAGGLRAATAAIGSSPGDSPAELAALTGDPAQRADRVLQEVGQVAVVEQSPRVPVGDAPPGVEALSGGSERTSGGCLAVTASASVSLQTPLPPAGLRIVAGSAPVEVRQRRFAETFVTGPLATVPAHEAREVVVQRDAAATPWHLQLTSASSLRACTLAR